MNKRLPDIAILLSATMLGVAFFFMPWLNPGKDLTPPTAWLVLVLRISTGAEPLFRTEAFPLALLLLAGIGGIGAALIGVASDERPALRRMAGWTALLSGMIGLGYYLWFYNENGAALVRNMGQIGIGFWTALFAVLWLIAQALGMVTNRPDRARNATRRQNFLFALVLLTVALWVNANLQPEVFSQRSISNTFRNNLPLLVLVVGQTMVIIAGGIDISVGTVVSLSTAVMVKLINANSSPDDIRFAIMAVCGVGLAAGAFNGLCVAYLRLQPIVTTYATSFIFAGIALVILPKSGGDIPDALVRQYRTISNGIPFTVAITGLLVIFWLLLRGTRYAQRLYSTGGKSEAAYFTGVPVNRVRFSTYMWSGLFAALAGVAWTISTTSGNPSGGQTMTLDSIVAIVLGGTRLSGGQGGVIGSLLGVLMLDVFRNIVSFAGVDPLAQDLVKALIVVLALVGPGVIQLVQRRNA